MEQFQYRTIVVPVTNETVATHDGTGTVRSSVISGRILSIDLIFGSEQTAATDVTISTTGSNGMTAETIYTKSNSNTNVRVRPRTAVHSNAGVGVTYDGTRPIYERFDVVGDSLTVALTGADNEATALTVVVAYEE